MRDDHIGRTPQGVFPSALVSKLPFPLTSYIRILGVQINAKLNFTQHIQNVLQKAGLRHGVTARLAGSTWVRDSGLLRRRHAALLTSLAAYALAVVGPGA